MRSSFNRTLGIACITTFFQLSSMAQNPAIPQAQSLQPAASSGVTSTTSASELPDISKPGKPKLDAQASLASERTSEKRYAALAFPVLRPKSSPVSEKGLEKSQDTASGRIAREVNAEIKTRSWTIPPLATRKRVAGEAGAESMIRAAITEPKISLNNPSIRIRVNPSESKLNGSLFTSPSMNSLGPPAKFPGDGLRAARNHCQRNLCPTRSDRRRSASDPDRLRRANYHAGILRHLHRSRHRPFNQRQDR